MIQKPPIRGQYADSTSANATFQVKAGFVLFENGTGNLRVISIEPDEFPPLTSVASDSVNSALRHMARCQGLYHYMMDQFNSGQIDRSTANLTLETWNRVAHATCNRLCVPDACPGSQGQMLLTWDRADHHLEIEIFPNGAIESFYRNRATAELWEEEYNAGVSITAGLSQKLDLFLIS